MEWFAIGFFGLLFIFIVGISNPEIFRIKAISTRGSFFVVWSIVFVGFIIYATSGEEEARLAEADAESALTIYARDAFGSKTAIKVQTWEDEDPPLYQLNVAKLFQLLSGSAPLMRTNFTNQVSKCMARISTDERLSKYKGSHTFIAFVETENRQGVTDTTWALNITLPNDLDIDWSAMRYNEPKFLKYLYTEKETNLDVQVNWQFADMKPDYWR